MDAAALTAFLGAEFPQVRGRMLVDEAGPDGVSLRMVPGPQDLRPGGTVSGPSMFALADVAIYLAVLSQIGPEALAVTTNASIDFMRKPAAGRDIVAQARILKLGRRLAVGEAMVRNPGDVALLARASMTYSIPRARDAMG